MLIIYSKKHTQLNDEEYVFSYAHETNQLDSVRGCRRFWNGRVFEFESISLVIQINPTKDFTEFEV